MLRMKKTNKSQMEVLINFLESNRVMVTGKTHPLDVTEVNTKWEILTNLLNAVENGARRDAKQWKTFLYEWKCKTKRKARVHKENIEKTGGGGYSSKELSDFENRLMNIFGWIHVVGSPGAPEEVDPDQPSTSTSTTNLVQLETTEGESGRIPATESGEIGPTESGGILEVIDESVNPSTSTQRTTGSIRRTRKRRSYNPGATKLEKAAESYSQSTEEMAVAVKEMATAISKLADAFCKIADALNTRAPSV